MSAIAGLLALVLAAPVIIYDFMDPYPEFWMGIMMLMFAVLLPLTLIADGGLKWVRFNRPEWSVLSVRVGFFLLTFGASLSCLLYHTDRGGDLVREMKSAGLTATQGYSAIFAVFLIAAIAMAAHWFLQPGKERPALYPHAFAYAAVSVSMMALPFLLAPIESAFFAGIMFIAYWIYVGWFGQRTGAMRLVSLAILILAIRVYILYLQAFGGLLTGGFGLILGGVVMLGMIYGAKKLNNHMQKLGGADHAAH